MSPFTTPLKDLSALTFPSHTDHPVSSIIASMRSSSLLSLGAVFVSLVAAIPSPEPVEAAVESLSASSTSSPSFGTDPIALFNLPTSFPISVIQDASSIEAIRNTLALYAFAIDGQNFAALGESLATNIVANYGPPLGVLTPLSTIATTLSAALQCVTTQHHLGTQLIQIRSLTSAFSITYYRALHFGKNALVNEFAEAYGQYQDTWQRQSNGKWKIINRNLVYMVSECEYRDGLKLL